MIEIFSKLGSFVQELWFKLSVPKPLPPLVDEEGMPLPPLSPEEAKKKLRSVITDYVAGGWSVEIENESDAVLSKKAPFHWVGKLFIFLLLLLVFAPLGLFYLIVVIVKGVNAKPARMKIWVDAEGRINRS
jgi:hypothetical protein